MFRAPNIQSTPKVQKYCRAHMKVKTMALWGKESASEEKYQLHVLGKCNMYTGQGEGEESGVSTTTTSTQWDLWGQRLGWSLKNESFWQIWEQRAQVVALLGHNCAGQNWNGPNSYCERQMVIWELSQFVWPIHPIQELLLPTTSTPNLQHGAIPAK